jgi:hypothetical protein
MQATYICNTWYGLNSSLLVMYKLLHKKNMLDKVRVEKVGTLICRCWQQLLN